MLWGIISHNLLSKAFGRFCSDKSGRNITDAKQNGLTRITRFSVKPNAELF
jgi:hypothetical protein